MRSVLLLSVVACIAGCPAPHTDTPDAMPGSDGPPAGASTLRIAWSTDKVIPGPIGNNNSLGDVQLRMENLEAVITVSPNDPRTKLDELKLHWDEDHTPATIVFDDAPPGRYTSVVLKLDSGDLLSHAFELHGNHDISGTNEGFEIEDDASLSISAECELDLEPGADMTLMLEVKIADAVNALDFTIDDDIHSGDPQMAVFRAKLQQSFTVQAQPTAE